MNNGRARPPETMEPTIHSRDVGHVWCEDCGARGRVCPALHRYRFVVRRHGALVRVVLFCYACGRDRWHAPGKARPDR